jgi:hypothetical protein
MTASWLGAIAAAAAVVVAVVARWPGRWLWHLLRGVWEFLEDWKGEPGRPGVPARPGVMERLQNVEKIGTHVLAETQTNGGSSMRDDIAGIAVDLAHVKDDLKTLTGRVELFESEREVRERVETIVTRPAVRPRPGEATP